MNQRLHLISYACEVDGFALAFQNDNDILRQRIDMRISPENLSDVSLHSVSDNGLASFLAYRDPQSREPKVVRTACQQQNICLESTALFEDPLELRAFQ